MQCRRSRPQRGNSLRRQSYRDSASGRHRQADHVGPVVRSDWRLIKDEISRQPETSGPSFDNLSNSRRDHRQDDARQPTVGRSDRTAIWSRGPSREFVGIPRLACDHRGQRFGRSFRRSSSGPASAARVAPTGTQSPTSLYGVVGMGSRCRRSRRCIWHQKKVNVAEVVRLDEELRTFTEIAKRFCVA
jgi:hypothetical protein